MVDDVGWKIQRERLGQRGAKVGLFAVVMVSIRFKIEANNNV